MTDDKPTLDAIDRLETKFNASLTAGLAGVNQAITLLTDMHHSARLLQEQRNADFATRRDIHDINNQLQKLTLQVQQHEGRIATQADANERLGQQLNVNQNRSNEHEFDIMKTTVGWLLILALAIGGPLVTILVNHLFK